MIYYLTKHEDPGHGWLAVPNRIAKKAKINISPYSYYHRYTGTAFLEEDCDMPKFLKAMEAKGHTFYINYQHTNDDSPIRNLPPYPQKEQQ